MAFFEFFRDIILEYATRIKELGMALLELLSEALGLDPDYLRNIGCGEGLFFLGHYYPPCPEPELTMGISSHSDIGFVNILLQDHVGGLQVQLGNEWFDVNPNPETLVVNLGDMMQASFWSYLSDHLNIMLSKEMPLLDRVLCIM